MVSKYFKIHELVPEYIFDKYGEKSWRFFNRELIRSIDALKETFPRGTVTINNWFWGGKFQWSGLRTPQSPVYSETSMHSMGKAADLKFSEYTADEVRDYILDNIKLFPFIKGLELGTSWVHIDCRNVPTLITFKG
jgi:hypothetical protein